MLEFSKGDSHLFRDKGLQGKGMYRKWGKSGRKRGKLEPKKRGLRTAIGSCPVRVWGKRGAGRPQTRFKGVGKGNPYLFGKEWEKGGVRTAIEARSVRVWGKRGAGRPQTRLQGLFRSPLLFI